MMDVPQVDIAERLKELSEEHERAKQAGDVIEMLATWRVYHELLRRAVETGVFPLDTDNYYLWRGVETDGY